MRSSTVSDDGQLYVVDMSTDFTQYRVQRFSSAGTFLQTVVPYRPLAIDFTLLPKEPSIEIGPDGLLYLADPVSGDVTRWDRTASNVMIDTIVPSSGEDSGDLAYASFLAFSRQKPMFDVITSSPLVHGIIDDFGTLALQADPSFTGTAQVTLIGSDGPIDAHDYRGRTSEVTFNFHVQDTALYGSQYSDANSNGIRDVGEVGLENWLVYLDIDGDGFRDAGEPVTYTDANGDYYFDNVPGGAVFVAEEVQSQAIQTAPPQAHVIEIEAEDFTRRVVGSDPDNPAVTQDWLLIDPAAGDGNLGVGEDVGAPGGVKYDNASGLYLQVLDDVSNFWTTTGEIDLGPRLEFDFEVPVSGLYEVAVSWDGHDGGSNSLYVSVADLKDGIGVGQADWYGLVHVSDSDFATETFDSTGLRESTSSAGIEVPVTWFLQAGDTHTLRLTPREDGVAVDRVQIRQVLPQVQLLGIDFTDDNAGTPSLEGFVIDNDIDLAQTDVGLWHLSQGRRSNANAPFHTIPDSLYFGFGENARGEGLYDNGEHIAGQVISPIINLHPAVSATLSFNYLLDVDGNTTAAVEVFDGNDFVVVAERDNGLLNDTNWNVGTIDLTPFAGMDTQVRFVFNTIDDQDNAGEGWYIDDITVTADVFVPGAYTVITNPVEPVLTTGLDFGNFVGVSAGADQQVLEGDTVQLSSTIPALFDIAQNPLAVASQSTTAFGGVPERAIDGNIDSVYNNLSISHTANIANSFWEVDLGRDFDLEEIVLFNRADNIGSRLSNFRLSVFDGGVEVFGQDVTGPVDDGGSLSVALPDGIVGDRVRVQLNGLNLDGNGVLSLAEVQVFGREVVNSYAWAVSGGPVRSMGAVDQPNFQFVPAADGTYSVDVTVETGDGNTFTDAVQVFAGDVPPILLLDGNANVNEGEPLNYLVKVTDPGDDTWTITVDYGDGTSDTFTDLTVRSQLLDHFYSTAGNYTAVVTVSNSEGQDSGSFDVTVGSASPTVTANYTGGQANEGDAVVVDVTIADPSILLQSTLNQWVFQVDWGDGTVESFASQVNVTAPGTGDAMLSHVYKDEDTYTVNVTVTDNQSDVDNDSVMITVDNVAPTITSISDPGTAEGEVLNFSVTIDEPGDDNLTITWDFGDGSAPVQGQSLQHAFPDNGVFNVMVTVDDGDGGVDSSSLMVSVDNAAPFLTAASSIITTEGQLVSITDIGMFMDDGFGPTETFSFTIDWGDGSAFDTGTGTVDTAGGFNVQTLGSFDGSHTYADNGVYSVTVTIEDDDGGTDSDTLSVTVNNLAPTVTPIANQIINEGQLLSLTDIATFIDPGFANAGEGTDESFTFTINWGDGTQTEVGVPTIDTLGSAGVPTAGSFDGSHTYNDDGNYIVTLTVKDDDGAIGLASLGVTVNNVVPVVTLDSPILPIAQGGQLLRTGSFTDPGADNWQVLVDYFGTGNFSKASRNGKNFTLSRIYKDAGTFNGVIKVVDGDGGEGMLPFTLNVTPAPLTSGAPVVVNPIATLNVNEDAAAIADYVNLNDVFEDPDDPDNTLTFSFIENSNPGMVNVLLQPDGTLDLSFNANRFGTADVRVRATDPSGNSTDEIFTVNVAPQNDAPIVAHVIADLNITGGQMQVNNYVDLDFVFNDVDDADSTLAYSIESNSNPALFDVFIGAGNRLNITVLSVSEGTATVTVRATDPGSLFVEDTFEINVALPPLQVQTFTPNASGFGVVFNRPIDTDLLNLYDGQDATLDPSDVSLIGQSVGTVDGSLVWEPASRRLVFVARGGVLADDTYDLTLFSRVDGFISLDANLLDGDNNGTAGGDFATQFTVSTDANARVLRLPDFARGPDQPVNVPAVDAGIPLSIDDGDGVLSVDFTLRYDPNLLDITAVTLSPDLIAAPGNWSVIANSSVLGEVSVTVFGTEALAVGPAELVRLTADVPFDATYRSSHRLRFATALINGGAIPVLADAAIHKVVYAGDASANGTYSGFDASLISRVGVALDTGFDNLDMTDPLIVADVDGDGALTGLDASLVARKTVGLSQPEIPDLPGTFPPIVVGGPDPIVTVPSGLFVAAGDSVDISFNIDDGTDLQAADFTFDHDTSRFNVTGGDVIMGELLENAPDVWRMAVNVDDAAGRVFVTVYAATPLISGSGELVQVTLNAEPDAQTGISTLDLEGDLNEGNLVLTAIDGDVTVTGGDIEPPTVIDQIINGGLAQRSTVTSIAFQFSENVASSLDVADLILLNLTTGVLVDSADMQLNYDTNNNTAIWTFPGLFGQSVVNGNYIATLQADGISDSSGNLLDGNGDGTGGDDHQLEFFRYFGDLDGDRDVDNFDLFFFRRSFQTNSMSPNFNPAFDNDNDGDVDNFDLFFFRVQFQTQLLPPPPPVQQLQQQQALVLQETAQAESGLKFVEEMSTTSPDLMRQLAAWQPRQLQPLKLESTSKGNTPWLAGDEPEAISSIKMPVESIDELLNAER